MLSHAVHVCALRNFATTLLTLRLTPNRIKKVNLKNTGKILATLSLTAMTSFLQAQKVDLIKNEKDKKIDVVIDGKTVYFLFLSG